MNPRATIRTTMSIPAPAQFGFDFTEPQPSASANNIVLADGELLSFPTFFGKDDCETFFQRLHAETNWQQDYLRMYGNDVALPRLTAWYGDRGRNYTYSHISMEPNVWTPLLLSIKQKIEEVAKAKFNSVLLNLYRGGNDGVSWHQDNEPELGKRPVIASLSFGATRVFQLRHLTKKELPRVDVPLFDGSLLIMCGDTQKFWQHRIPKTTKPIGARINLTFRFIHT
jgi:alkylated DNA repair dioxygenase AlkB